MSLLRLLCLFLAVSLTAPTAWAGPLRLGTSVWSPYVDQNLPGKGLAIELVTAAFKEAGYDVQVEVGSWPRTLEGAKIGVYDVIPAAWYTEERAKELAYSKPYLANTIKFIRRKGDDVNFNGIEDLRGKVIGVVAGYAYGPEFDKARGLTRFEENHVIQNLLNLINGEVQLTLGDEWVLRHETKQYLRSSADQLEILPRPLDVRDLHIAVSRLHPDHEKIIAAFDEAIEKMKKDGRYQAIIDRHLNRYLGIL